MSEENKRFIDVFQQARQLDRLHKPIHEDYSKKWEELKKEAEKILSIRHRIEFYREAKHNYLQSLSPDVFNVSGIMTLQLGEKALFLDRLINQEIAFFQEKPDLFTLFNEGAFSICLELLEYLEITIDSKYVLGKRGGKLFGAITAIKQAGMLKHDSIKEELVLDYFNRFLGIEFKGEINKRTEGYKEGFKDAERFLKRHYFK